MLAKATLYAFTVVYRTVVLGCCNIRFWHVSNETVHVSLTVSVGLHVCDNLRTTEWIVIKFCIGEFYQKLSDFNFYFIERQRPVCMSA